MSSHDPRITQAWLTGPDQGVIELSKDWTEPSPPRLVLGPDGPALASLEPVTDHGFGCESGYFANALGEIFFFLQIAHYPHLDPESTAVYLAGDFNGWQHAVGNSDWRLLPASLDGEPVLLHAAPGSRFFTQPPQRFKFVTGEHQWLPVSARAPNAARDEDGNYNYVIDPVRTGRHWFHFTTAGPVDLTRAQDMRWADDPQTPGEPLRPGDFFLRQRSHVPLGANVTTGGTIFRLFAPRAAWVRLHLSEEAGAAEPAASYDMDRRSDGAWEAQLDANLHGWYYWYTLDGPHDVFGSFDANRRVLDPYALAAVGRDGPGIVIDRSRLARADRSFPTPAWHDLVIAEGHVRDLTAMAPVKLEPRERLGFTGLRKWVESPDFHLARLGVNAVELQPVQEADHAGAEDYQWGYMPVNWFAPSSAYALAPERASQIEELQELVAALHRRGMAVLLDVVYNHSGVPGHLMHIDKFYYFEQNAAGELIQWSGCGNDFRVSAAMARRLIIDSLIHLVETFGVDGFRFDLAELLGLEVLREIETAIKRVKPDVILIAEPWSFRGHIARELSATGFASWNDGYRNFLRDYVRGGGSRETLEYFLQGSPEFFAAWPAQTVNYTESHDDRTWIDVITENTDGNGYHPTLDDCRRTHLMAAILMASIGLPMVAAGQDFMRSKQGVNNTYLRGDLNVLDYRRLYRYPATHAYFADWIAYRRSDRGRLFRHYTRPPEGFFRFLSVPDSTATAVIYNADRSQEGGRLLFAVNPTGQDAEFAMDVADRDGWRQVADHERFFEPGDHEPTLRVGETLFLPALACGLWEGD